MSISLIAAVGKNYELGKDNNLIWRIPADLKYFKSLTTNKTVVMGRLTYESIGKSLPNRKNIVLTSKNISDNNIIVSTFEDVLKLDEDIFIIGGEQIYKLFINYADNIYLTLIESECLEADKYFPTFNKELYNEEIIEENKYNDLNYKFVRYRKVK